MRANSRPSHRAALLVILAVAFASAARAATVEGTSASFQWASASGPVAGYDVWVQRDGAPLGEAPDLAVTSTSVTVNGVYGESLAVQVAAFDAQGNVGPRSAFSETVLLTAPPPPPAGPPRVTLEAEGDFSLREGLAQVAGTGEQLRIVMRGTSGKQLLDLSPEDPSTRPDPFGFDQLVVGQEGAPTTVRLIDSISLAAGFSFRPDSIPPITLFGLGEGEPCARDGDVGLRIHTGSVLVLGGLDLWAFDGERCTHINELFPGDGEDPNVVAYGDGEIRLHGDLEADGVADPDDNCLVLPNPDQCDTDGDGYGNRCDADLNGDGYVDAMDLFTFYRGLGPEAEYDANLDFDCSGAVNELDYEIIADFWQEPPGPSGLPCAAAASCSAN